MTDSIVVCHSALTDLLGSQLEPLAVIQQVERHRRYWRPEKPRLVLLAESHVHTTEAELGSRVRMGEWAPKDLPSGFVRFVYCLGYGENELLTERIKPNPGTWQFWKIFYSCINRVTPNASSVPALKGTTKLLEDRMRYKLKLLQQMKDAYPSESEVAALLSRVRMEEQRRGELDALRAEIQLVDASIAALYRPRQSKPPALYEQFLQTSWNEHVQSVLEKANPKGILCIGRGVAGAL